MPVHLCVGLGGLHLASEVVEHCSVGVLIDVDPVLLLALGRQRGDVLADVLADGVVVKRADEVEGEVGCVGGALLSDLHDAVVVHILQALGLKRAIAPGVVVERDVDRVGKCSLGLQALVLECGLKQVHDVGIGLVVLADVGHAQVGQLEHGLEVLDGRLAAQALGVGAQRQAGAGLLAGQCLLQLLVAEVAQSALHDGHVEELGVGPVLLTIERAAAL